MDAPFTDALFARNWTQPDGEPCLGFHWGDGVSLLDVLGCLTNDTMARIWSDRAIDRLPWPAIARRAEVSVETAVSAFCTHAERVRRALAETDATIALLMAMDDERASASQRGRKAA